MWLLPQPYWGAANRLYNIVWDISTHLPSPVKMFSNPLHLPKWELWLLWLYRDCAVLSDRCSCSAWLLNAFSQTQTQTDTCAPTEELNHQHHHTLEYTERRTDKYLKWTLFVSVSILFISINVTLQEMAALIDTSPVHAKVWTPSYVLVLHNPVADPQHCMCNDSPEGLLVTGGCLYSQLLQHTDWVLSLHAYL